MTEHWKKWDDEKPEVGAKVVIVCEDGCSSSMGLAHLTGCGDEVSILDGEDGQPLGKAFLKGALWASLPAHFPLYFMEIHPDG
jgi:hypothetical protein